MDGVIVRGTDRRRVPASRRSCSTAPEAMNAMNTAMALRLAQVCAELAADRRVTRVVLYGTGPSAPSAWAPTSKSATG